MAVEWAVSVGVAVAKVALRLYGDQNLADMVEDVAGVRRIGRQPQPRDLGEIVADQIEAALPEATRARMASDPEVSAAAEIATRVVERLATKPEALAGALARSSDLLAYVRAHDGGARQQWVAQHAESVYDEVLATATRQLVALAPQSGRARSAAMTEALQQLATINAQVQELLETVAARDAFVPLDTFTVGRLNPASVMNDRGPLAGRSSELDALAEALDRGSSTFRQLVVVTGPGGRGKSRLAVEALKRHAQSEPSVPIVCLSTAHTFSPTMLHELRRSPLTVLIDDAHTDPLALAPLLSHVRNNRDIQLVLATRPSGRPEIEQQISLALFSPAEHTSIEVAPLELREARALVRGISEGLDLTFEMRNYLADQARHSPHVAVITTHLIRNGQLTSALAVDASLRSSVLARYQELQSDIEGFEPPTTRRVLATYASLGPVAFSDENLKQRIAAFCGMTVISLSRMVRVLTDRGVLHVQGDALRVVPDVLADQYTEVTAVEEGYDTGFVAELWHAFGQDHRRRLVLSLGELDWRLSRTGGPNIMAMVWEDLRNRLSSQYCSQLCEELGHLDQLAATQPSGLVSVLDELRLRLDREDAAGLPAPEEPEEAELVRRFKLSPRDRDSVRALMPALYGRAAAHMPEVLEQVLDALWSLRLAEDRSAYAQQDRTKDGTTQTLLNLAVLPHASFPKRVVAWATTRTETMTFTIRGATPLVVLKPLLVKEELETVQPSLRKLEFRPHLISATAMRTVRDQIRRLLTTRGQSDDLRLAGAAVELLGYALTEPHGYFNNRVPKETILSWEDDDLATVRALDHVATTTRSAVIRRLIRSKVAWSAEYATSALVQHAAIALAARMDALDDVEDQVAELIAGGTLTRITERYASVPTLAALSEARRADEERTQHLSDQERQDDRTTSTRSKVTARREAADRRMKAVTLALINRLDANEILALLNSVARDIKAAEPSARLALRGFWQEMSTHAPHFFATAARAIATDQPGPLDDELGTLITQWLHHEPTDCMSWLETAGGSGRAETRLAIARAVSAHEWQGSQLPDLRAIWSRGIDDDDPIVAQAFLASAGGYLRQDPEHAAPLLVQHDISQFAACSALDEASRYEGQEFGAALRPDQAAAMLPLITTAGFTEASPAGILTGIATTQPHLVLGHLLRCAQAGTALPDNIDGLSRAFEENAESLATWVISQLGRADPILLGDVVTTATNGRLTERQAQAFHQTTASLDGDDLVVMAHTLNNQTIWVIRHSQLAEAIMVRARETRVDEKARETLRRGARLSGWGSTNGVSDELNQALALAEQALSSTGDIDLRQIYTEARDQFKTRIDALAREEADETDEEW